MARGFELHIELAHIEPKIWRKIQVPESLTLADLHFVIQGAMGWENSHMHMFRIGQRTYEIPFEGMEPIGMNVGNSEETVLADILKVDDEILYVYDFGDDWTHQLVVEGIVLSSKAIEPRCTGGMRACPPEDCGGPFYYPNFAAALTDPNNPEHEYMSEHYAPFDPEGFKLDDANKQIKAMLSL